jgi:beta-lactamase class A
MSQTMVSALVAMTHRTMIAGTSAFFGVGMTTSLPAAQAALAAIEGRYGGRLGVFAVETESGRTLAHRADERFLMCSTFKGLLAAQVLSRVDLGQETLTRLVPYSEKDLIFTSPVTKAGVAQGALSVATLCQAMVEVSDNTAAILLMRSAGGPEGLTRFVRSLDDAITRSDRFEPESNQSNGILDTTAPRAIVGSVRKTLLGDVLSQNSRELLEGWMIAAKPGLKRLRAAFPADWVGADRPGTSLDNETNDYALARPPGRAPLLVAAYYDAPQLTMDLREAVLRDVGAVFVTWAG